MSNGAQPSFAEAQPRLERWIESSGGLDSDAPETPTQPTSETQPKPSTTQQNTVSDEETEEAVAASEEQEGEQVEAEAEESEEAVEELEEAPIQSLEQLAEFFEVEPDDVLQGLQIQAPDGDTISIGDALERWRNVERSIHSRRDALEQEYAEKTTKALSESSATAQRLVAQTKAMAEYYSQEFPAERMAQLRQSDPEEYIQMFERKQKLERLINGSLDAIDAVQSQAKSRGDEDFKRIANREVQLLVQKMPALRDQAAARDFHERALAYAVNEIGFTEAEFAATYDHRMYLVLNDAMLGRKFRQGGKSKKVEELKAKGLRRPTTNLKSRARQELGDPVRRQNGEARARLKKTGDVKDAARAIELLL